MAGERVQPYRSRRDGGLLEVLRGRVHDWITEHATEIEKAEPKMPVEDRAADVWESLIIIADLYCRSSDTGNFVDKDDRRRLVPPSESLSMAETRTQTHFRTVRMLR